MAEERDKEGKLVWTDGSEYDYYGESAQDKADRVKSAQLQHELEKARGDDEKTFELNKQIEQHGKEISERGRQADDVNPLSKEEAMKYAYHLGDQMKEQAMAEAKRQSDASSGGFWANLGKGALQAVIGGLGALKGGGAAGFGQAALGGLQSTLQGMSSARVLPHDYNLPNADDAINRTNGLNGQQGLALSWNKNGQPGMNVEANYGNFSFNGNTANSHQRQIDRLNRKDARQERREDRKAEKNDIGTMEYQDVYLPNMKQDLRNMITNMNTVGNEFKVGADTSNKQYTNEMDAMEAARRGNTQKVNNKVGAGNSYNQQQRMQQAMHPDLKTLDNNRRYNQMVQAGNEINQIQGQDDTNWNYGYKNLEQKYLSEGMSPEQVKGRVAVDALMDLLNAGTAASIAGSGMQIYSLLQSGKGAIPQLTQALSKLAPEQAKAVAKKLATNPEFIKQFGAEGAKQVANGIVKGNLGKLTGVVANTALKKAGQSALIGALTLGANQAFANTGGNDVNPNTPVNTTTNTDYFNPSDMYSTNYDRSLVKTPEEIAATRARNMGMDVSREVPLGASNGRGITPEVRTPDNNFDQATSDRNMEELSQLSMDEYNDDLNRNWAIYDNLNNGSFNWEDYDDDELRRVRPEYKNYTGNSRFNDNLSYLLASRPEEDVISEFNQDLTQEEFDDFIKSNPYVADMIMQQFMQDNTPTRQSRQQRRGQRSA